MAPLMAATLTGAPGLTAAALLAALRGARIVATAARSGSASRGRGGAGRGGARRSGAARSRTAAARPAATLMMAPLAAAALPAARIVTTTARRWGRTAAARSGNRATAATTVTATEEAQQLDRLGRRRHTRERGRNGGRNQTTLHGRDSWKEHGGRRTETTNTCRGNRRPRVLIGVCGSRNRDRQRLTQHRVLNLAISYRRACEEFLAERKGRAEFLRLAGPLGRSVLPVSVIQGIPLRPTASSAVKSFFNRGGRTGTQSGDCLWRS